MDHSEKRGGDLNQKDGQFKKSNQRRRSMRKNPYIRKPANAFDRFIGYFAGFFVAYMFWHILRAIANGTL